MTDITKKNVEGLSDSEEGHRSEESQNESNSYGLSVGDLVFMNELAPGDSSIPGLLLSLPGDTGQVDILIDGMKRNVYWNQIKPYIDNVDNST